jgi:hypothetical protein
LVLVLPMIIVNLTARPRRNLATELYFRVFIIVGLLFFAAVVHLVTAVGALLGLMSENMNLIIMRSCCDVRRPRTL